MPRRKQQKDRVQVYNPRIDRWVIIDSKRGGIISVKKSPGAYKNVKRYKKS